MDGSVFPSGCTITRATIAPPFMRGERDHLTDDYLQPRHCDAHLQVLLMNFTVSSSPNYISPLLLRFHLSVSRRKFK